MVAWSMKLLPSLGGLKQGVTYSIILLTLTIFWVFASRSLAGRRKAETNYSLISAVRNPFQRYFALVHHSIDGEILDNPPPRLRRVEIMQLFQCLPESLGE